MAAGPRVLVQKSFEFVYFYMEFVKSYNVGCR